MFTYVNTMAHNGTIATTKAEQVHTLTIPGNTAETSAPSPKEIRKAVSAYTGSSHFRVWAGKVLAYYRKSTDKAADWHDLGPVEDLVDASRRWHDSIGSPDA